MVVLPGQIKAFGHSAEALRARAALPPATLQWDDLLEEVEHLVAGCVSTFELLGRTARRHRDGAAGLSDDTGAALHESFKELHAVFAAARQLGETCERQGMPVAGKSEFVRAWRELSAIVSIDPKSLAGSFEELERGGGTALEDFAREISSGPRN